MMARLFGRHIAKSELVQYVGSLGQVCGATSYVLSDGKAAGTRGIDVKTGSGLDFTVLPDRALDVSFASYRGRPLCHVAKTGVVSSTRYEPEENGWFRSYFAGLLTTCGLSNTGAFCEVDGEKYGLHGRISNTPAEQVNIRETWNGDELEIEVSGSMRESVFYAENLLLTRRIVARMGEKRLFIHDRVENQGFSRVPLFMLYHFNIGFPLLDENSELLLNAAGTDFFDEAARGGARDMLRFQKPTHEYLRQVFLHTLRQDPGGTTTVALVNRRLEGSPLGVSLTFDRSQLPEFFTFKMMGQGDYQLGLEPSNCLPMGRAFEKARDGWKFIEPQSTKSFDLEIEVIDGEEELAAVDGFIKGLR
jgi:hypothetical protein